MKKSKKSKNEKFQKKLKKNPKNFEKNGKIEQNWIAVRWLEQKSLSTLVLKYSEGRLAVTFCFATNRCEGRK